MKTIRILVADDDRSNCALISKFLKRHGYVVDVAYDGAAALKLIEQNQYAMAVLDYQMPECDGIEVYKRSREVRPEMPGIFLTSFTTLDTVYPAITAGVERVLAKPVQLDELQVLVERLAGRPESSHA